MKLFELDPSENDNDYCFISPRIPFSIDLIVGDPVWPRMREQGMSYIDLEMDEDEGGLKLPDIVGNTDSMIVLRNGCLSAITNHFNVSEPENEILPARLINEKGRVHSDDYSIVNPLGRIECLDIEKSDMNDDEDDPAVQIFGKYWLRSDFVPADRDLFRVKGVVGYIISERLFQFITDKNFSNFFLKPVQVS